MIHQVINNDFNILNVNLKFDWYKSFWPSCFILEIDEILLLQKNAVFAHIHKFEMDIRIFSICSD